MSAEVAVLVGDVATVLAGFRECSFDACVCDPPYGFSFMGKSWDYDVPSVDTWRAVLRVLKPGASLVAFGGSRTYHRLACAIEDAGFELRDCLMWLYGKGFPKSQNIGLAIDKSAGAAREVVGSRVLTGNAALTTAEKGGTYGVQVGTAGASALAQAWDGWGTALKPAHEPIVLARKPLEGTMANNVARWGVGGLAINGCRIGGSGGGTHCNNRDAEGRCLGHGHAGRSTSGETFHARLPQERWATTLAAKAKVRTSPNTYGEHRGAETPEEIAALICKNIAEEGRWPANLILDEDAGAILDASVTPTRSTPYPANVATGNVFLPALRSAGGYTDAGGPSRFFYCAKVSTKEREAGCEGLAKRSAGECTQRADFADGDEERRAAGLNSPRAGAARTGGARNHHPTLKPISLTTWLARLVAPPAPGAVLVPFAGAGSEVIGCALAGWQHVVGIEQSEEYAEIARARIAHWVKEKT